MIDINIKTVLLGSSKIGKTSLVRRFVENKFKDTDDYTGTIGGAFISKEVFSSDCRRILLCIWDTAGEEKYESVTRTFYRNSHAAIVCYDVTCAKSWNRAKRWVSELKQFEEKCIIYLCATKFDLLESTAAERAVSVETVSVYVSSANIKKHFETSSKTGRNVGEMFYTVARNFMELNKGSLPNDDNINLRPRRRSRTCCFKYID